VPRKTKFALASIRKLIGKSQRDMGRLLGISTRSVQSYEQGWRAAPVYVMKLAAFFLALKQRKVTPRRKPCWMILKCQPLQRDQCLAHQLDAGDLCWLATGNRSCGREHSSWESKLEACRGCPVMQNCQSG
jgi:hypothetical protein